MGRITLFVVAVLSSGAGSVSGVAVDINGAVIPQSKIVAISKNGDRKESKSDHDGRFAILELKPGIYRKVEGVRVAAEDETRMPAIELSVAAIGGCEGPIPNVGMFAPTSQRSSELSGRVSPAGAFITVLDPVTGRKIGSARADAHGRFTVVGLRPGKYDTSVRHSGYAEQIGHGVEIRNGFMSEGVDFNLTACANGKTCPATKWNSDSNALPMKIN